MYTEGSLEIGFRTLQVAKHEDTRPWLYRNSGCQFPTTEGNRLCLQWIAHSCLHRVQCIQTNTCSRTSTYHNSIVVIEFVLSLSKQIGHGEARCHIRQEPQGMRKHIEQSCIAERHRWAFVLSQLQVIDTCRKVRTTDKVEPLLNLVLIFESGLITLTLSCEKQVQVELVKLAKFGYLLYFIRHTIGEHHHSWQGEIRITATFPFCFGTLFIRVSPVENLFFDKLTIVDGSERCTRQEKIIPCRDRKPCFIDGIACLIFLIFFGIEVHRVFFIFLLEQLLRPFFPCTEMVFVEDDQIPIRGMYKFVLGLNTSAFVGTK